MDYPPWNKEDEILPNSGFFPKQENMENRKNNLPSEKRPPSDSICCNLPVAVIHILQNGMHLFPLS